MFWKKTKQPTARQEVSYDGKSYDQIIDKRDPELIGLADTIETKTVRHSTDGTGKRTLVLDNYWC